MAFPQITGITSGSLTFGDPDVPLPSGVTAGERLQVLVTVDKSTAETVTLEASGTGWTTVAQSNGVAVYSALFEKLSAAGDSSDAVSAILSGNAAGELGSYVAWRISGHDSSTAAEAAVQTHADVGDTNPSTSPDAPSLTPSWGSADTLWVWGLSWDNGTVSLSAYPTNYSSNQTSTSGAGTTAAAGTAVATRENAASSENPGTATLSAAEQWSAWTIAIKPAGASGSSGAINVTTEVVGVSITGEAPVNGTISVTTVETQVSITGSAGSASNDIRLQPSLYLERGGYAASLTADRWIVFTSDLSAVENTGTALSINSTGRPTIDITGSTSYTVGDYVPLFLTVYDEGSAAPDRTVRTFFGWVQAQAQA